MEYYDLIGAVEDEVGFRLTNSEIGHVMDMAGQADAGVPMTTIRSSMGDSFDHFEARNRVAKNEVERERNLRRHQIATAVETVFRENGLQHEAA